jgi:hypothetical protein
LHAADSGPPVPKVMRLRHERPDILTPCKELT